MVADVSLSQRPRHRSTSGVPLRDQCIHEVFEAQAARTPYATALSFEGRRLTYRQVSLHSTRFATRLRSLGVRPGAFVALYAPRSLETIVSLLGILKAGGAYVALDMESPADRIELMLSDVQPAVILTLHPLANDLPSGAAELLFLNEEFDFRNDSPARMIPEIESEPATAQDLAYVAFTSGSTGTPKGVCITHRGVVALAKSTDFLHVRREDIFLQFAPLSFDASTFEVWNCLLNGARLAIFPPWKPSLSDLGEFIEKQGVSILWLGAGLFHQMAENHLHHLIHVRRLFTGGDVISVPHAQKALETLKYCRLVNGYGPTENTTFSCCYPILTIPPAGQSIPIGTPVAGTECHVLDEMLRPVKPGKAGELFLGGDGLAAGYLRNPRLTGEKFISIPSLDDSGARFYRTGDRVRQWPDGNLEFLGRLDRQVKILGYRVEPVEIEAVLRQHPGVWDASVVMQRSIAGEERLIAAVAMNRNASLAAEDLRAFAGRSLPQHMIPSEFILLDELPLNANGKIDQEAVAARCAVKVIESPELADYRNATMAKLAAIWTYVLGRPNVRANDNFFELGGNSLRAAHLLARVQKSFGKRVPMNVLARRPTLEGIADYLDEVQPAAVSPLCLYRAGRLKPGIFCLPGQGGEMVAYMNTVEHFTGSRPVYGLQSPALLGQDEGSSIEELAALHVKTIRELQPSGPYHLFGYCFGGLVAFEVARQLNAQGAELGLVGVLQFDVHDMPFAPFDYLDLRSIYNFLKNLFPSVAEFFRIGKAERNTSIMRLFYKLVRLPGDTEESYPPLTVERTLQDAHELAWRRYVPTAFPGVMTVFRPHRLPVLHPDPKLGWGLIEGQRLEVQTVSGWGIHGDCISSRNGAAMAKVIEKAIETRERELR